MKKLLLLTLAISLTINAYSQNKIIEITKPFSVSGKEYKESFKTNINVGFTYKFIHLKNINLGVNIDYQLGKTKNTTFNGQFVPSDETVHNAGLNIYASTNINEIELYLKSGFHFGTGSNNEEFSLSTFGGFNFSIGSYFPVYKKINITSNINYRKYTIYDGLEGSDDSISSIFLNIGLSYMF